jgi:hypothetical protein
MAYPYLNVFPPPTKITDYIMSSSSNLVAYPSLSESLCYLPQAKDVNALPIHPSTSAKHAAESEAKVRPPTSPPIHLQRTDVHFKTQLRKALFTSSSTNSPEESPSSSSYGLPVSHRLPPVLPVVKRALFPFPAFGRGRRGLWEVVPSPAHDEKICGLLVACPKLFRRP